MKNTLYQISAEYAELITEIEAAEGELTPELEERLTITSSQLQSKSIAYLAVIRKNEFFTNQIDEEIKRLQAMKKKAVKVKDDLEGRLLAAIMLHGEFETEFNKFGTLKSTSVEVDNVNWLPDKYKTVKVVETADKRALKEAIKAGEEIEGVELKEHLNLKIN